MVNVVKLYSLSSAQAIDRPALMHEDDEEEEDRSFDSAELPEEPAEEEGWDFHNLQRLGRRGALVW